MTMCPRCRHEFFNENEKEPEQYFHAEFPDKSDLTVGTAYTVRGCRCPKCEQFIIWADVPDPELVYPRVDLSKDVPETFHKSFREACWGLKVSPNNSATGSRRCLEQLLTRHFQIPARSPQGNFLRLSARIQELVKRKDLPKSLADDLLIIKDFGNRGAHPASEIEVDLDVTREESEWLIEILTRLFEFLFVAPRRTRERRIAFNEKRGKRGIAPIDFEHLDPSPTDEGETVH